MIMHDPFEDNTIAITLDRIKKSLGIDKSNAALTNDEIKAVCRKFGERESDTLYDEKGEPVFGPKGVEAMLTVTLYYYPRYYVGLSQPQ